MIIYNDLQHYYDNRCSPESWSLLLLAENSGGASDNLSQNTINACFKRRETRRMFGGVLSCSDTKTES